MRRVAIVFAAACCCACGEPGSAARADSMAAGGGGGDDGGDAERAAPVTMLAGEMHLHQFPLGSHAWTAFVEPAVPVSSVRGQSITEIDTDPTRVEGPCTLYVAPTCAPACDKSSWCRAPNECAPLPAWTYFDAGAITVTGSRDVPVIRFSFDTAAQAYVSDPPPGRAKLFEGGEALVVSGGRGDWAVAGQVTAPPAVVFVSPAAGDALRVPTSGAFDVRWQSEQTGEVDVLLAVSTSDGRAAEVRCVTSDTGEMLVPPDFVAALPPPPRSTRLEVMRSAQRTMPLAKPGFGVLVHAAYSAWMNGED